MKYNGVLTAIWNSVFPNAFLRYGYSFTAEKYTVDRCSNLDPETGYPEFFSWFSAVGPGTRRDVTFNYATTDSFHILSNSSFIYPFIRRFLPELMKRRR
jgi:hypothetical protein